MVTQQSSPETFQVLQPFFEIKMGGLERIYEYPNIPVDFEFSMGTQSKVPTVRITLFDEAGAEVEPYIEQSKDPHTGSRGGTFKFGYKGTANLESAEYSFYITNVVDRYVNNAFVMNIYGNVNSFSPITSSNQLGGTLEDIIKDFCDIHKLDYEINPPFGKEYMQVRGGPDNDTTEKREIKYSKLGSESDWRFLLRCLSFAIDDEGKPGYIAFFAPGGGGAGSRSVLKILKARDTSAQLSYTIQGERTGVIEWSPQISYLPVYDQEDTHFNGYRKNSGDTVKVALNTSVTEDKQNLLGGKTYQKAGSMPEKDPPTQLIHTSSENMEDNVTSGAIRSRSMSSRSLGAGINPILYSHIKRWTSNNTAELTVIGDPSLTCCMEGDNAITLVDIDFRTPINYFNTSIRQKHYTSGKYMLSNVIHRISVGVGFITTLSLDRAGLLDEPELLPKEGQ